MSRTNRSRTCRPALIAVMLCGCINLGPPSPTDAAPPPECQQIIDRCSPYAADAEPSTAHDCVRTAQAGTTTAAHCLAIQSACTSACSADASVNAP